MKFRSKVFLVLGLAGGVPMIVTAVLTWQVVTTTHRDDVAKLESAALSEKAAQIQSFVDNGLLSFPKVVIPSGLSLSVSPSAQIFALQQTLSSLSYLQSESFVDLSGRETVRIDRAHMAGYPSSTLSDMSGSVAFQTARSGSAYLGPVIIDGSGNEGMTFALPVKSDSGDILGVVVGTANAEPIAAIMQGARIGDTGYLYLVTQNGAVVGGGGPFEAGSGAASASGMNAASGTAGIAAFPIVTRVLAGNDLLTPETQMRYTGATGGAVVGAGKALEEHGNVWALVAEWPTAEADAVLNSLILRYSIVLLALILAVVILSFAIAYFLVRPIRKLEEASARVAKGKFDEGVSIATGDELQELGDAFNTMVLGLKEFEQLKDEFVFVAAHELRTPVAAMKGYLSLILDGTTGAISDGTRAFIEKVINSNNRLIQLVNDLLEVARSQAGRLTIKVAPVAIAPAISSTLDELKALADEKSVALVYAPPADLPGVLADGDRIKEVVVNLIGNSIKYMGGAGTVTITHEVNNGKLITHIADTGLGMSKEAQEKLFQKFYRVQTDKTKDIIGTGLGLFIVKEIIEKMNGTIWVDSEEGKGSVFSFALALA